MVPIEAEERGATKLPERRQVLLVKGLDFALGQSPADLVVVSHGNGITMRTVADSGYSVAIGVVEDF